MEGSAFWGILSVISTRPNNRFFFKILGDDYLFVEQIKLAWNYEISIEEGNLFFVFKRQRKISLVAFEYHILDFSGSSRKIDSFERSEVHF